MNKRDIEDIWLDLHNLEEGMRWRGREAREKARAAYKKRDLITWGKFNAVARICEHNSRNLFFLVNDLQNHVPQGFLDQYIPF